MPKKTKKQKLRADNRHADVSSPVAEMQQTFQFRPNNPGNAMRLQDNTNDLAAIRVDLVRTITLAIFAVSLELGIYWRFF